MLKYLDSEVTPGTVHLGDISPRICLRVIPLAIVHPGYSVESTNGVNEPIVPYDPYPAPPVPHGGYQRPLVGG